MFSRHSPYQLGLHLQKESNGLAPYSRKNNQLSRLFLHFVGLLSINSLEVTWTLDLSLIRGTLWPPELQDCKLVSFRINSPNLINGRDNTIWTCNNVFPKHVLYQVELYPDKTCITRQERGYFLSSDTNNKLSDFPRFTCFTVFLQQYVFLNRWIRERIVLQYLFSICLTYHLGGYGISASSTYRVVL